MKWSSSYVYHFNCCHCRIPMGWRPSIQNECFIIHTTMLLQCPPSWEQRLLYQCTCMTS